MIKIKDMYFKYEDIPILRNISLEIEKGSFTEDPLFRVRGLRHYISKLKTENISTARDTRSGL